MLQSSFALLFVLLRTRSRFRVLLFCLEEIMETRVAVMAIIVEDTASAERINSILHEYGRYIIGRMGVPYREKSISVMSVAVDAPQDVISTMSGRIGKLNGVSVKTAYSQVISHE